MGRELKLSALHVDLWAAINAYAAACGGDTSEETVGPRRINAVVQVERALAAMASGEQFANPPAPGTLLPLTDCGEPSPGREPRQDHQQTFAAMGTWLRRVDGAEIKLRRSGNPQKICAVYRVPTPVRGVSWWIGSHETCEGAVVACLEAEKAHRFGAVHADPTGDLLAKLRSMADAGSPPVLERHDPAARIGTAKQTGPTTFEVEPDPTADDWRPEYDRHELRARTAPVWLGVIVFLLSACAVGALCWLAWLLAFGAEGL